MTQNAEWRDAEKMDAPFFQLFFHFRPLFPIENVNFFEIFFLIIDKAVNIHNWKPLALISYTEILEKFMENQIFRGRFGEKALYVG